MFYDYLFLNSNCAIKRTDGELIIGNNSENADSAYFSEDCHIFVKPTEQMKLCKSPEEELYLQHEHELTRLWGFPKTQQPRQRCGNGSACTWSSQEGQQRSKSPRYVMVETPHLIKTEGRSIITSRINID